jgi:hypothetical protein
MLLEAEVAERQAKIPITVLQYRVLEEVLEVQQLKVSLY